MDRALQVDRIHLTAAPAGEGLAEAATAVGAHHMLRTSGFLLMMAGAAMGSGSTWAQPMPEIGSPQMMYRMGAANEAALKCRDLRIVDKLFQSRMYQDASSNALLSKAMAMGIEDFEKEFSVAYSKGREQDVCRAYLRRYPSLLEKR